MSNIERVNQFLLDVYYAKQQQYINSKAVYSMLIRNDVEPNDIPLDNSQNGNFDRWCQRFGIYNGKNIETFVDPNWSYFCQFKNKHQEVMQNNDQVKVYIPLDGSHLTYGVEAIFDFLERNNIAHSSKVGKNVRFDDVVVRLGNLEDAEKLSQFISSNPYIQEGLIESNPFAVTKNGIAYASDREISYNSTVAAFVNLYVDDAIQRNDYSLFGVDGFRKFILNYYNEVIINPNNYQRLINDFDIRYVNDFISYNYIRVAELLYKSLDYSFTYDDYCEFYNRNLTDYFRAPEYAYGNNVNYIPLTEKTADLTEVLIQSNQQQDSGVHELMKKALIEFGKNTLPNGYRKYSNDDVIAQIYEYFETGNPDYITNSGNLRNDFIKADFRATLTDYACTNSVSFSDILVESKKQIFEYSLLANQQKYADGCDLSYSIKMVLDAGDYTGFTRNNCVRENMAAAVDANDISKIILKEMNYPPSISFNNFSKEVRDEIIDQYTAIVKDKINVGGYSSK